MAPPNGNKTIFQMAGPLIVSFVMRSAFTFVDTAFAATLGDEAVAAIGLTVPYEFLMIALWVGMSTGFTSTFSRALGAHQGEKAAQYLKSAKRMVTVASLAFFLFGIGMWFWIPHMRLDQELIRPFQIYAGVLLAGSGLTGFWAVIPDSIVKAHQDTKTTMWSGIFSNVVNITLNTFFLFVMGWGIFGIAFSTVVGRLGGLIYASIKARQHERCRLEENADTVTGKDKSPTWTILRLAIPSALTFSLMAMESGYINELLKRAEYATEALAGYSIYYRISMLAITPVIAVGVAMLPFAARRFGQNDACGVAQGFRQASAAAIGYALVIVAPLTWFFSGWVANALTESELTAAYAVFGLRVVPIGVIFGAGFLLCRPVFEAMEKGMPGLIMAIFRFFVLTLPATWFGMKYAADNGYSQFNGLVVALLAVAFVSTTLFSLWLWFEFRKKKLECERA